MSSTVTKVPISLVRRIILERDLTDSRTISCTLPDGGEAVFCIRTLTQEEKDRIRLDYDKYFPTPPVIQSPGGAALFDLEDETFQKALQDWNLRLSKAILAATLGISETDVATLEKTLPREFLNTLFATIELLNGIQSDPLIDLVRDAVWSPEVTTWLETKPPEVNSAPLTDTPLFREMDAMIASGLTLEQWEKLSPRHKIMYLNFHTYKAAREAYLTAMAEQNAGKGSRRR